MNVHKDSSSQGRDQNRRPKLIGWSATKFPHSARNLKMSKKSIAIMILGVLGMVIALGWISDGLAFPSRTGVTSFKSPAQAQSFAISGAGTALNGMPDRLTDAVRQSALGSAFSQLQQPTRQSGDVGIAPAEYLWPDTADGYRITADVTTVMNGRTLISLMLANNVPIGFTADVLYVTTAQALMAAKLANNVPLGFMEDATRDMIAQATAVMNGWTVITPMRLNNVPATFSINVANVITYYQTETNNAVSGFPANVLKAVNDRTLISPILATSTPNQDVPSALEAGFTNPAYVLVLFLWLGLGAALWFGIGAASGDFKRGASFWSVLSRSAASRRLVPFSSAGILAAVLARSAYAIVNAKRIAESAGYPCRFAVLAGGL